MGEREPKITWFQPVIRIPRVNTRKMSSSRELVSETQGSLPVEVLLGVNMFLLKRPIIKYKLQLGKVEDKVAVTK